MNALYAKLIGWIAECSGVQVIVRHPNATAPQLPYVTLRISSDTEQTYFEQYEDDADTGYRLFGFTLQLMVYGRNDIPNMLEAATIAERIKNRINDQLNRNNYLGRDCTFNRVLSSNDVTTVFGTLYEPRYSIDLQMTASVDFELAEIGKIERIETKGIVNHAVENTVIIDGTPTDVTYREVATAAQIDGYEP